MSYQVIARKWRPNKFDELVGQSHVSQTLLNAIQGNRIPHALLFTGPRGTGKTSTARILAKSLRCPNAINFSPCNECAECDDIAQSRSLDVIEIDGASNNGVDAIRELRDTVSFMPASGKFKIYIIDEVHMLTGNAFNALLKTLEEPPAHVLFVMATTEVQKIPNTVLSRCQRYDFRKISTRQIAEHLEEICTAEKVVAETEALWAIARQGDGSMRDSQSLLDQVISFCNGNLTLEKVTDVLGLTDRALLNKTIEALISRETHSLIKVVESLFESGYDPLVFMKDLLEELRHLVIVKVAPEQAEKVVDLPLEEIKKLIKLSHALSEEDIHLLFDMALKGTHDLHRVQDTRVVLDMVLLRMSIAPRMSSLLQLKTAVVAKAPTASTQTAISTESAHSHLDERWSDFVARVTKVNGLIGAKLEQLHLLALSEQKAQLGIPEKYKFLQSELTDLQFQNKIVNYMNTFWGPGHALEVKMINAESAVSLSPQKLVEKKTIDKKEALTKQVEEHPLVRQAKTIFNTQIKSIREN